MRKHLSTVLLILSTVATGAMAAGGGHYYFGEPNIDHTNFASLQRGAQVFMNYCSGCHSMRYLRYNRMAKDIGITKNDGSVAVELLQDNLMFTTDKAGDHIVNAMPEADAKAWFGVAPPDLTLVTRARTNAWVYNYLLSFYDDPNRPWGVNNVVFKDVGMPNVLADLQGKQAPVYRISHDKDGHEHKQIAGIRLLQQGSLKKEEFTHLVNDLVNFMSYAADPVKVERERIGTYVLLFLFVLLGFAYLLKREYWKDIH